MLNTRQFVVTLALLWASACAVPLSAWAQVIGPANSKLALRAALVFSPEFCATKMKDKVGESFDVGRAACTELEPILKKAFSALTVVASPTASAEAQVVLLPRFVAVDRTSAMTSFSKRKLVLLLEWTVKDASGKIVWLETVQGSAVGHGGTIGTVKKNREKDLANVLKSVGEITADKLSSAVELRKLADPSIGSSADKK